MAEDEDEAGNEASFRRQQLAGKRMLKMALPESWSHNLKLSPNCNLNFVCCLRLQRVASSEIVFSPRPFAFSFCLPWFILFLHFFLRVCTSSSYAVA